MIHILYIKYMLGIYNLHIFSYLNGIMIEALLHNILSCYFFHLKISLSNVDPEFYPTTGTLLMYWVLW